MLDFRSNLKDKGEIHAGFREEGGLEVSAKNFDETLRVTLTPKAFDENKQVLTEVLQQAVRDYEAS